MKLAVDARWMNFGCRGMGRHAYSLVSPVSEKIVGLLPRNSPPIDIPSIFSGPNSYALWEQLWLPLLCKREEISHVLCPYNTAPVFLSPSTSLILVVHDLIFLSPWSEIPPSHSLRQELGRLYRKALLPHVIGRASRIITVSNYSRDLIAQTFKLNPADIAVIPNSLNAEWFVSEPLPLCSRTPYILTVTGDAPSKNLSSLIHAFSILKNSLGSAFHGLKLRVVGVKPGSQPHFASLAMKYGVSPSVLFEGYIDQYSLIDLYRKSLLFVLPSLSEGFGIPIIEAMASGTPVACSGTTSLPEILGDCGWYFDPRSPRLIAKTMAIALTDHQQQDKHIQAALLRAQQYSQASVARQVHHFWDTL